MAFRILLLSIGPKEMESVRDQVTLVLVHLVEGSFQGEQQVLLTL